jgi:aminopeptidase N
MAFKRFIFLLILISSFSQLEARRSDSIHLIHTDIHLSVRNFTQKTLSGNTIHKLQFLQSSDHVKFDLSSLSVDSVKIGSNLLNFSHIASSLKVSLDRVYAVNDSAEISIFYKGQPATDPSGWGGFYFNGDHAFNLGVGFQVYPHSFGRAWFPCFDDFDIKTSYDVYITTDSNFTAAGNGILKSVQTLGDSKIWHYQETVPLSAYLVAVSVSKYQVLNSNFNGMSNSFPIQLFCKASDSAKVKSSFENLPKAIEFFENSFGAQPYSKVGYNFVPFNGGAMEHAGNITYPIAFANGSKDYEKLMAHELSHHWWGDLVTCKDAGDMWLNEGWASYCEHLFLEKMYNFNTYMESINQNHFEVLRYAHINDGQVFGLINIPQSHTYGSHVYKKGADVIHSIRFAMGDSLFFKACNNYLNNYRLSNASTADMKAIFENVAGNNLGNGLFESLVENKGFPHFTIRKQEHSGNGPYKLKIWIDQNNRFNDFECKNIPLELTFFRDLGKNVTQRILINNNLDSFEFTFDFKPIYVAMDYHQKLNDAITDTKVEIDRAGVYAMPLSLCQLIVNEINDSALIRIEHHWVGPEKFATQSPYMSKYRYYTLDGIWPTDTKMDLELTYDGRQGSTSSGTGYLDHTLIFKTEDSLRVMYRAFPGDYWREWKDVQFTYGNKSDKQGKAKIINAQKGDYVFAMQDINLSVNGNKSEVNAAWKVYPVPAKDVVKISFANPSLGKETLDLIDENGKTIGTYELKSNESEIEVDLSEIKSGVYFIQWRQLVEKIIVEN